MSAPARHKRPAALRKQDDAMGRLYNELGAVVDKYHALLDIGSAMLVVGHLYRKLEKAFDDTRPKGG